MKIPWDFPLTPAPRCHRLAQLRDDFGQQLRTHQVLGVGRRNVPEGPQAFEVLILVNIWLIYG
jgi:hypothetical protein